MTVYDVNDLKVQIEVYKDYLKTANSNCSWAKHAKKQVALLEQIVKELEK